MDVDKLVYGVPQLISRCIYKKSAVQLINTAQHKKIKDGNYLLSRVLPKYHRRCWA